MYTRSPFQTADSCVNVHQFDYIATFVRRIYMLALVHCNALPFSVAPHCRHRHSAKTIEWSAYVYTERNEIGLHVHLVTWRQTLLHYVFPRCSMSFSQTEKTIMYLPRPYPAHSYPMNTIGNCNVHYIYELHTSKWSCVWFKTVVVEVEVGNEGRSGKQFLFVFTLTLFGSWNCTNGITYAETSSMPNSAQSAKMSISLKLLPLLEHKRSVSVAGYENVMSSMRDCCCFYFRRGWAATAVCYFTCRRRRRHCYTK